MRDHFLKSLSEYSMCIKPYLRNIHDKYVVAYYLVEREGLDFNRLCVSELDYALEVKR